MCMFPLQQIFNAPFLEGNPRHWEFKIQFESVMHYLFSSSMFLFNSLHTAHPRLIPKYTVLLDICKNGEVNLVQKIFQKEK